uniref:Uncharacterized protein n=1 Tax=Anguilla anguilla TaxID=7936 RepID=A0A0E9XBR2_ANGAN
MRGQDRLKAGGPLAKEATEI